MSTKHLVWETPFLISPVRLPLWEIITDSHSRSGHQSLLGFPNQGGSVFSGSGREPEPPPPLVGSLPLPLEPWSPPRPSPDPVDALGEGDGLGEAEGDGVGVVTT